MSWSIKFCVIQSMLVGKSDALKAINTWIEDVTVHGEAMRCPVVVRCNCTTEAIQLDLLVSIVKLKD